MTQPEKIAAMKSWAEANYHRGADTIVECWEDEEFAQLLGEAGGSLPKAIERLRKLAGVYADRQADADYERRAGA